jgi:hypothetical protein
MSVAEAGDPLTKPKNGPKSCVAEKPVHSEANAVNFDVVAGQWLFLGKVLQRWCFG